MDIASFFGITWFFGMLVSIGSPIVKCSGDAITHLTAASSAADAGEGNAPVPPADDTNPFAQAEPDPTTGIFDRFVQWLRVNIGEKGDYDQFRKIVKWGLVSVAILFVCSFMWIYFCTLFARERT